MREKAPLSCKECKEHIFETEVPPMKTVIDLAGANERHIHSQTSERAIVVEVPSYGLPTLDRALGPTLFSTHAIQSGG